MRFNTSVYSNIIAGVIAAVIYVIVSLATGASAGSAILGAVLLGLGTFVVALLISQAIVRAKRGAQ